MAHKLNQFICDVTIACKTKANRDCTDATFPHLSAIGCKFSRGKFICFPVLLIGWFICFPALFIGWFIYFPALVSGYMFFRPYLLLTYYLDKISCVVLGVTLFSSPYSPYFWRRPYSLCGCTCSYYFLKSVMFFFFLYTLGERKRAIAKVTVKRGSGNVTVNDVPFTKYFGRMEDRYGMNL